MLVLAFCWGSLQYTCTHGQTYVYIAAEYSHHRGDVDLTDLHLNLVTVVRTNGRLPRLRNRQPQNQQRSAPPSEYLASFSIHVQVWSHFISKRTLFKKKLLRLAMCRVCEIHFQINTANLFAYYILIKFRRPFTINVEIGGVAGVIARRVVRRFNTQNTLHPCVWRT